MKTRNIIPSTSHAIHEALVTPLASLFFLIFEAATLQHSFRTSDPFRDANDPKD